MERETNRILLDWGARRTGLPIQAGGLEDNLKERLGRLIVTVCENGRENIEENLYVRHKLRCGRTAGALVRLGVS